jgi:hypothetical protein
MTVSVSTIPGRRATRSLRLATAGALAGAALVTTFAVGRSTAPGPRTIEPQRRSVVVQQRDSAPHHRGFVKEG